MAEERQNDKVLHLPGLTQEARETPPEDALYPAESMYIPFIPGLEEVSVGRQAGGSCNR